MSCCQPELKVSAKEMLKLIFLILVAFNFFNFKRVKCTERNIFTNRKLAVLYVRNTFKR